MAADVTFTVAELRSALVSTAAVLLLSLPWESGVPDWAGNLLVLGFVSFLGVLAQSSGVAASVAPQLACNYRTAGLRAVLHY